MIRRAGVLLLGLVLTLSGCGDAETEQSPVATPTLDHLPGAEVGAMAERELERAHPGMAPGRLSCPDLRWSVGSSVRCVQLATLSAGRQLRIPGTVRVTDLAGGGRLHVRLDDEVAEYGLAAEYLTSELIRAATRRFGAVPTTAGCPYLSGPVGTTVVCTLVTRDRPRTVRARVTARDDATNATEHVFDWVAPKPVG